MERNIFDTTAKTIDMFISIVKSFPKDRFNTVPFAGSWTAAQVTDHILKAVSGLPSMLSSDVVATERNPGEKIGMIESVFLDFSTKMKSPDFILPSDAPLNQDLLLKAWAKTKNELLDVITTLDLSMTSNAFELPGMGAFTRLEWIWFAVCHIKRHTHQLQKIHRIVVEHIPADAS